MFKKNRFEVQIEAVCYIVCKCTNYISIRYLGHMHTHSRGPLLKVQFFNQVPNRVQVYIYVDGNIDGNTSSSPNFIETALKTKMKTSKEMKSSNAIFVDYYEVLLLLV